MVRLSRVNAAILVGAVFIYLIASHRIAGASSSPQDRSFRSEHDRVSAQLIDRSDVAYPLQWLIRDANINAPITTVGPPSGVLAGGTVRIRASWEMIGEFRAASLHDPRQELQAESVVETGVQGVPIVAEWPEMVTKYTWSLIFGQVSGRAGKPVGVVYERRADGGFTRIEAREYIDSSGALWRFNPGVGGWILAGGGVDSRLPGPVRVDGSLHLTDARVVVSGALVVRDNIRTSGEVVVRANGLRDSIYAGGQARFGGPLKLIGNFSVVGNLHLVGGGASETAQDCRIDGVITVAGTLKVNRPCTVSARQNLAQFASRNGILTKGFGLGASSQITVHDVALSSVPGESDLVNTITLAEVGEAEPLSIQEIFDKATAPTALTSRSFFLLVGRDPRIGPPDVALDGGEGGLTMLAQWPDLYRALIKDGHSDLRVTRVFFVHGLIVFAEVYAGNHKLGIYLLREGNAKVTVDESDIAAYYYALENSVATRASEVQEKLRARWLGEWLLALGYEVDEELVELGSFPETPPQPPPEEQGGEASMFTPTHHLPTGGTVFESADGSRKTVYLPDMAAGYSCLQYDHTSRNYGSCLDAYVQEDYIGILWDSNGCSPTAGANTFYYFGAVNADYSCLIDDRDLLIRRMSNNMQTFDDGRTNAWRIDTGLEETADQYPDVFVQASETTGFGWGSNDQWLWVARKILQGRPTVFSQTNMVVDGTQVDHTVAVVGYEWRRVERWLGDQKQRYFKVLPGWYQGTTMIRFDSYTSNAGYVIDRIAKLWNDCAVSGGGGGIGGGSCRVSDRGSEASGMGWMLVLLPLGALLVWRRWPYRRVSGGVEGQ